MSVPSSTYRLQMGPGRTFADAAALIPYLARLGVGAVYLSPVLQAAPGSTHGYDVADPRRVSTELGGEEGRLALVAAAREHGLSIVVDIVPNHVGVAVPEANPLWWDVLRHGPQSQYASWFDIDGWPLRVPVLGEAPTELDALRVDTSGEEPVLRYHEHTYPIAPGTDVDASAHEVHEAQHYRLVPWTADLGYRRFFAVSDLAAVRVEDPEVFDGVHDEVLRWVAAGDVDGLRVDHPDGLTDPTGYAIRLREHAPDAWLVVEKILEPGETLPASWPVDGTTGYDALAEVDGVLLDPAGETVLSSLDREFGDGVLTGGAVTGGVDDYAELVHGCKLDVATGMLGSETRRLARLVSVPDDVGFDSDAVFAALAELAACFPVYRSYLVPGDAEGVEHLDEALADAARRRPDLVAVLDALAPRLHDPADELAIRFQQTSGAVMAKGVEDTAYYRFTRFVAANEVGGAPGRFGLTPQEFHDAQVRRAAQASRSMTTLSTHDTKRSADVRARLAVLAEIPTRWRHAVDEFTGFAAAAKAPVADPALGHLLWQNLVGAWPAAGATDTEHFHTRFADYLRKAMREARTRTGWAKPDRGFEAAMQATASAAFTDRDLRRAVEDMIDDIAEPGWSNALSATLIQLTMPGVPDTYQGGEAWDFSLVDPDNRRPVNFARRDEMLARLDTGHLPPVDASGAAKLLVVSRALRARREHPERFTGYTALAAVGPAAEHAIAFERSGIVTVATRLPVGLATRGGWSDTTLDLPEGSWTDLLTRRDGYTGSVPLATLLDHYPVALMAASPPVRG